MVIHLGTKRHGADDIETGERRNLIIWNHNHRWRASRTYRRRPAKNTPPRRASRTRSASLTRTIATTARSSPIPIKRGNTQQALVSGPNARAPFTGETPLGGRRHSYYGGRLPRGPRACARSHVDNVLDSSLSAAAGPSSGQGLAPLRVVARRLYEIAVPG